MAVRAVTAALVATAVVAMVVEEVATEVEAAMAVAVVASAVAEEAVVEAALAGVEGDLGVVAGVDSHITWPLRDPKGFWLQWTTIKPCWL